MKTRYRGIKWAGEINAGFGYDSDEEQRVSIGGSEGAIENTKAKVWEPTAYLRLRYGGRPEGDLGREGGFERAGK